MKLFSLILVGGSLAVLGGCTITKTEGSGYDPGAYGAGGCDDEGHHDQPGVGGSGSGDEGAGIGEPCDGLDVCAEGLLCDFIEEECVEAPETCEENIDCGTGYICVDEACVASALCTDQEHCDEGYVCDDTYSTCVPGDLACADVDDEQACSDRPDCEPVYAGVDCSCGPDCTCQGGEPGCVCDSFEFFVCEEVGS